MSESNTILELGFHHRCTGFFLVAVVESDDLFRGNPILDTVGLPQQHTTVAKHEYTKVVCMRHKPSSKLHETFTRDDFEGDAVAVRIGHPLAKKGFPSCSFCLPGFHHFIARPIVILATPSQ